MTQKSLKMTRDKLAEFLPDHESIRKFEELLAIGDSLTQTTIFELLLNSSIAELPKPNQFTTADFIDFRVYSQSANKAGRLRWDADNNSLSVSDTNGVINKIGDTLFTRVINLTGSTIPKGTVVSYLNSNSGLPIVSPFNSSGTTKSFLGVVASDIDNNGTGKVINWGQLNGIDVSGYLVGTLLYVDPFNSGFMTDSEPTPPYANVLVGMVTGIDSMLVSPYVDQNRLTYGTFSRTSTQTAAAINTGYPIAFNLVSIAAGINIGAPASKIITQSAGVYEVTYYLHTVTSAGSVETLYVWLAVNGVQVSDSASTISLRHNGDTKIVTGARVINLQANDYIEVFFAVSDTRITIQALSSTSFSPAAPSCTLSLTQIR
jgi:hypothetical protein